MKFKTLIINAEIAEEYGYPAAIMLHHISYWVEFNKINKQCKNEGVYWMYRTYEDLASEYPGFSPDSVKRAINKLVKAKLITSRLFFAGEKRVNHYRLTDKGHQFSAKFRKEKGKLYVDYVKLAKYEEAKSPKGAGENASCGGRNPLALYMNKNINKNFKEKTGAEPQGAHARAINQIIGAFRPLGRKINYGNTTERAAALSLIETCGEDQAIMFAENAVLSTQARLAGDKYAPLIKNAYDLERKLVNLANYLQRPVQERASIPKSWRSILED